MDESYEVYEIKLRMRIDRKTTIVPPAGWDWDELLDLAGEEYVQILSSEFIGRSIDIDDKYSPS